MLEGIVERWIGIDGVIVGVVVERKVGERLWFWTHIAHLCSDWFLELFDVGWGS